MAQWRGSIFKGTKVSVRFVGRSGSRYSLLARELKDVILSVDPTIQIYMYMYVHVHVCIHTQVICCNLNAETSAFVHTCSKASICSHNHIKYCICAL